jgi:hypothetical protein
MRIVESKNKVTLNELKKMAADRFGDLIKAVVDVKLAIMVIDKELYADEEALLIEKGSTQGDLWGINLHPEIEGDDFIAFGSMINLRPSQGNRSRGVADPEVRNHIQKIVADLVIR